jgi:hypothetical protein
MQNNDMQLFSSITASASTEAICFDAGDVDDLIGFKFVPSLFKIPFDPVWIEATKTKQGLKFTFGYIIYTTEESHIDIICWRKLAGEWAHMGTLRIPKEYEGDERTLSIVHFPARLFTSTSAALGYMKAAILHVGSFFSALNCVNVRRVETVPDAKLQKARARRGKPPLFSYWTLELALPRTGGQKANGGGTHTSPRLHLCRGHIKKRKTGYFWWQPHVRGNKDLGMVHKDYSAKYTKPEGVSA